MRSCFPLTLAEPIVYVFVGARDVAVCLYGSVEGCYTVDRHFVYHGAESQVRTPYTVSFPAIFAFRL
jgi:hypothetical protein